MGLLILWIPWSLLRFVYDTVVLMGGCSYVRFRHWLGRWALPSFVELHEVLLVVICIGDLFGVGDEWFVVVRLLDNDAHFVCGSLLLGELFPLRGM